MGTVPPLFLGGTVELLPSIIWLNYTIWSSNIYLFIYIYLGKNYRIYSKIISLENTFETFLWKKNNWIFNGFYFFEKRRYSNFFKSLTILSDVCSLLVLHLPGYYRKKFHGGGPKMLVRSFEHRFHEYHEALETRNS